MFEAMLTNGTLIMEALLLAVLVVGIASTFNKDSSFDGECISTRCMVATMSPLMVLMLGLAVKTAKLSLLCLAKPL